MRRRCPTPRIPILIVFAGALILAGCNRQKSEFLMIRADHGVLPRSAYPTAVDPARVGTYDPLSSSGAGYFYDDVLEYRVWVHPDKDGLPLNGDKDYFFAFAQYEPAAVFAGRTRGSEDPIVLIRQREWINEPEPGHYIAEHVERMTSGRSNG
jgi:hypothetical protein